MIGNQPGDYLSNIQLCGLNVPLPSKFHNVRTLNGLGDSRYSTRSWVSSHGIDENVTAVPMKLYEVVRMIE